MVDANFDFAAELNNFSVNEDILNTNLENQSTPTTLPDSTMTFQPEPPVYLTLCINNPPVQKPNETQEIQQRQEFLFPPPSSSTTADVQQDWISTPSGMLFGVPPLLPLLNMSRRSAASEYSCAIESKLDALDNLTRILFFYRNVIAENGPNASSVFFDVKCCMEKFLAVHDGQRDNLSIVNQLRKMEIKAVPMVCETEERKIKWIDRVAIPVDLWRQAAAKYPEGMKEAGKVLLTGIFSKKEMQSCTVGSRLNKSTGKKCTPLDGIKLGVIFKILAWMKMYGCGGDSWNAYDPKNPFNPVLSHKELKMLREVFSQQLNQAKQKMKIKNLLIMKNATGMKRRAGKKLTNELKNIFGNFGI